MLGLLVDLEPAQAELLARVGAGPLLTVEALREGGAFAEAVPGKHQGSIETSQPDLFGP